MIVTHGVGFGFTELNGSSLIQEIVCYVVPYTATFEYSYSVTDAVSVSSGVPQGSAISRVIHINVLPDNEQSQVRLLADDTAIYLFINHQSGASPL